MENNIDADSILEQPVEILELSIRAADCLRRARIKTIRELTQKSREDLLAYKFFGKISLEQIEMKLKELGGVALKENSLRHM